MAGCRGRHRYNGEAKFASWLTTIGIRRAQSRWSDAVKQVGEPLDVADFSPPDGRLPRSTWSGRSPVFLIINAQSSSCTISKDSRAKRSRASSASR